MRLSVTARLALLAIILSLASSFLLIAVIRRQVTSDALATLQRETTEQAATYRAVARAGGYPALRRAVAAQAGGDDDALIAALYDRGGRLLAGAGPDPLATPPRAGAGVRIETIGTGGQWDDDEAGFIVQRIGRRWLVTGRLLDDRERGERAIERASLLALALSLVLGIAGGLIVTRYVTGRLDRLASAADGVAAGDLSRRVGIVAGGGDAFDRLGLRVNAMLDRVERLMAELRLVTDSLGHDLRSPLARVRGRLETALAATQPEQRDAAVVGALGETDALLRMLATLLEIGRSEAMPRDRLTACDPAALVSEVADLYGPVVEDGGLAFELALDESPAPLSLHRELLTQAISNLLDNALRHGGTGPLVLRLAETAEGVVLSVEDRGDGIAAGDRGEALSRFGRLDPARSAPGAGLGLALVDAVARLHGGRVELADNAPGLIVHIVLPRSGADRAALDRPQADA